MRLDRSWFTTQRLRQGQGSHHVRKAGDLNLWFVGHAEGFLELAYLPHLCAVPTHDCPRLAFPAYSADPTRSALDKHRCKGDAQRLALYSTVPKALTRQDGQCC